jgi:thiol reductant ABC exporter CydC subunit
VTARVAPRDGTAPLRHALDAGRRQSISPSTRPTGLGWVVRLGWIVRWRLLLAILAGVTAAGMAVGLTSTAAWLISRAAEQPPVLYLMVAIVAVRAFGVGRGAFRYAERLASHDAAFRILGLLRSTAYRRLERLAPAGLAEERSGDLVSRLVSDVDGLADVWLRLLLPYAVAAIVGGGAVLLVAALVPAAALALLVTLLVVAIGAPLAAAAAASGAERVIAPTRGRLAAASLELLRGAPELAVAGATARRLAELERIDDAARAAEARAAVGAGLGNLVTGLAAGAAVWLAVATGIVALRAGELAPVALAVVVLTPIAAHELAAGLAPAAQQLPRLRVAADRLGEILTRTDPVAEPAVPAALPAGPYGIRIRGLRARYPAGGTEVLHGIDLEVAPGQRALISGPSGAGKTTLAAVLLRFLDPSAGRIDLVGSEAGVDITELDGDTLRSVVGLCPQDVHLFDTTIADNIRLARPAATDVDLRRAIEAARLDGWIGSLPDGLETRVGELGAAVSAGQRQRIGLARALLADWPVIIFDEPTEHLDEATAAALTADLLTSAEGRTAIFISHRPELLTALADAVRVDLPPR